MPAQEHKAIEDMDHEELLAALPELREEAVKADMRVQAAIHRLAQTADVEVPTYVEVHEDHLVVDVRGEEKLLKASENSLLLEIVWKIAGGVWIASF